MTSTKRTRRRPRGYSIAVADLREIRPYIGVFDLLDRIDGIRSQPKAAADAIGIEVEVVLQSGPERRVTVVPADELESYDTAWPLILGQTGWILKRPRNGRAWAAMVRAAAARSRQ